MEAKDARKLYEQAKSYWSDNYEDAKEDLRFAIGEQHWTEADIRARAGRPCHVINQLPQFIHQVTNDMRQNTPSINVLPVGGGSDIETAKIFKGLIRNIEYESGGDEIYDTAGEYSVKCGIGFIRVDHDYEADDSFKQKLYLKRVHNPMAAYIDPSSVECDGSDAEWGFILDTVSKDVFDAQYPDKQFVSFDSSTPDISTEESIVIAEFYKKEYTTITKAMGADGAMVDYTIPDNEPVKKTTRTRKLRKVTIKRYKFSGTEMLEESTFPGIYIPLVPVYGEEVWVDGERRILSLIRQSKDAQRKYNHWASKETEILSMAPIAPVMAAVGQIEDFEDDWTNPNNGTTVLRYHQTDAAGNPAPRPERLAPPPVPVGIINAMQGAKEDIKATMGLYNASIGQRSNETSGVAINARKVEGDVATFHFADNRNRSIMHVGRILVNAIPEIYDTSQIIRIINEEDAPSMVGVNGEIAEGQKQHYDLTRGKYDVRVSTGASYTTKRQEAAALFGDVIKNNPPLMQAIGDIWAGNLDVAGADALKNRLHKMVPPPLLSDEERRQAMENQPQQQQQPDPEKMQMQQTIEQMHQQMQQMGAALQDKQAQEQAAANKNQLDAQKLELDRNKLMLDSKKLEIEAFKVRADVVKTNMAPDDMSTPQDYLHPDMSEDDLLQKLSQKQTLAQKAEQKAMLEAQEKEAEAQREAQEIAFKQAELAQRQQQADALINTLAIIAQQVNELTNKVGKPVQIVRDENGMIVGGAPVNNATANNEVIYG